MSTASTETAAPPGIAPTTDLAWLSVLRIVAITGVITIHTVGGTASAPNARETLHGTLAIYLDLGATCMVPLFVMMSGATLLDPGRYADPGTFLRKRALRLVPPLVFWHVWYFAIVQHLRPRDLTVREAAAAVLNGNLYTALYFFWIIAGLALVSPVLVPFIRSATRRQVLIAGGLLASMPALSIATREIRGVSVISVDTPWTWWLPYVGLYLLGYGLRDVILRKGRLVAAALATVFLGWLHGWQWRNPQAPALLSELSPVSYYSALTIVYAVLVYLVFRAVVRPDGLLRPLARGRAARIARTMGDATLGVFGLHLTVLLLVQAKLFPEDGSALSGALRMGVRLGCVWVITYVLVLVLRRVPIVRAVL